MDEALKIIENEVQIVALCAMAIMYFLRIRWLMSLPATKEWAKPKNSPARGILLSFGSVLTPWSSNGARQKMLIYIEFALFHIAVAIAIALSFIHPYASHILTTALTTVFVVLLGLGLLSGVLRLIRRITVPQVRVISTPDDYFSIILLNVLLALSIVALAVDNSLSYIVFFIAVTFFLLYVPWSKISHYLYLLFTKFFFGFYFGRRGVIGRTKTLEV